MERDKKIDQLWNMTVDRLLSEVDDPDSSPAMLQSAIRFLKDNAIEGLPIADTNLSELAKNIPFPKVGVG